MRRIFALLALVLAAAAGAATAAAAAERFPILQPDALNAEQKKLLDALLAGPRGGGDASPEAVQKMLRGGPFNAWMRSPDLGNRLQNVGAYIRYKTSLPLRLNEFAILIIGRQWRSQVEWAAHAPLAIKAGLAPQIVADLKTNTRPANMPPEEAVVYDFVTELTTKHAVSDETYDRAKRLLGEQQVVDLTAVAGGYVTIAMILAMSEMTVPPGREEPFKPGEP